MVYDYQPTVVSINHTVEEPNLLHKAANVTAQTANQVTIKSKYAEVIQTKGMVQGGSECVKKFSDTLEIVTASVMEEINEGFPEDQWVMSDEFVDDMAITIPRSRAGQAGTILQMVEQRLKLIGLNLTHGPDKDGVVGRLATDLGQVQKRQAFTYLGTSMTDDPAEDVNSLPRVLRKIIEDAWG